MRKAQQDNPVETQRLAAAAASFVQVVSEMHERGRNPVTDLLGSSPFNQWDHYPPNDVHDNDSGAVYFYHAHDPTERENGEHGHFHCFINHARIKPSALPIYRPKLGSKSKSLCHLAAVSIGMNGLPFEIFTTNQWVTGEVLYPSQDVIPMLDAFRFLSRSQYPLVSRWLESFVALFRLEISQLLQERDVAISSNGRVNAKLARRRSLEILSSARVDIDAKLGSVKALARRGSDHDK